MLDLSRTTIARSVERSIRPGYIVDVEGAALVSTLTNGTLGVSLATGAANERFMGFSMSVVRPVDSLPAFQSFVVVDAAAALPLQFVPNAGTVRVTLEGAEVATANWATALATTADAAAPATITVAGTAVGNTVTIAYTHNLTTTQARLIQGDPWPGIPASAITDSLSVIEVGDVFTSLYDTTADWSAANPVVRLGANGCLTTKGAGTILNNVLVIQAPVGGPTYQASLLGVRVQ